MIDLGIVKPGSTIRIPFDSFAGSTGASAAASNFAAGDILVYKDGNTTARASTSGYTATTSFSSVVGINFAIIDLADNTTAGFFSAGSEYVVVISPFTVDSQTMAYAAARFVIGIPVSILSTTIATLASQTSFTLTSGPAEDDAIRGCDIYFHDVASAVQGSLSQCSAYTGSTKTVTLNVAPSFTIATTDNVMVLPRAILPITQGRRVLVGLSGHVGVDWANVASQTTVVNLTNTTIKAVTDVDTDLTNIEAKIDIIDATADAILVDTAVIGALGAGLTAIPWNAAWDAEVQSEATDALNAYDPPTKAELDAAVANVSVDEIQASALADLFNTNSGETYGTSVAGSVVKEIADNSGGVGGGASAADVWAYATRTLTALDEDTTTIDLDNTIRSAVGMASANLDTQLAAIKSDTAAILVDTDEIQSDVNSIIANGISITAGGVDTIFDEVVEGTVTFRQSVRLANAALGGKASGLETTNALYRDLADTKNRIDATVDADGNRSAVTRDLT